MAYRLDKLATHLRGWMNYFGFECGAIEQSEVLRLHILEIQ